MTAPTFVGANITVASSGSTPTHAVGDLLIVIALRWASNTIPSLPAGWTSAHTASDSARGWRIGWKIATATNDSTGTWTNAQRLHVGVWRDPISIGAAATQLVPAETAQTPGLTLTQAGSSTVATFGHSSDTSTPGIPSGTTSRWTSTYARWADTNGPVGSWAAQTVATQWLAASVELVSATTRVSSTLDVSRTATGRVSSTLAVSRTAEVTRVSSTLAVSRQAVARILSTLAVVRSSASYGTWSELILTPQWLDAVAARTRELSARAELVDAQGTPQPIIIDGTPQTDLPLAGASVTFSGEDAVQWSASLSWAHPWMVPTTATHPLWGARSLFVRLWWRIYSGGAWLEMPVCTVAIGDTSATDDGTISGTTKGRDVLSLLRGGYGAPLTVSGMTIDVALRAIFERCAPTLPVRIFPTTVTVPATLTLGEQDPLKDALELAAIGYTDGTVRSDREGVVVCGPRPEPVSPVLDWQEGPDCPVPEMTRQHGIEHMGNRITVSSTHVDAVGLYVTVEDDDPSSPTYVGGPWGVHPLPGIETDKATTAAALRSIGLMQLGRGLKPTEDVDVTVPQRPDLTYRHPVKLARALVGVAGVHEVSSWSLTLPASGAVPAPMKVGMMRRYVR